MGVFISTCAICYKKVTVLSKAIIGGTVIDLCEDCLIKYKGKKIDITEVDKIIIHTDLIRSFEIKK